MRSIILRLLVAVLTCIIGLMSFTLIGSYLHQPTIPEPQVNAYRPTNEPEDYSKTYRASCSCTDYPSRAAANELLRRRLKSDEFKCYNSGIIERGAKLDQHGQEVGKRVVAEIGCGEEGQTFTHIIWTEGAKYCEIRAETSYGALNFERVRKP